MPGFKRDELKSRYDVAAICEDTWHAYSGTSTAEVLDRFLGHPPGASNRLLNAGAGVYTVVRGMWVEISLDLFQTPIQNHSFALCGSVERLPFRSSAFGAVVCVGEVLGYCDPATAIAEFARVLMKEGLLICDFASSRSPRYWLKQQYGRAADLVTEPYNGAPERTWIYDPNYIISLLKRSGFILEAKLGIHTWSALGKRIGFASKIAVALQKRLEWLRLPTTWADVTTIVARRYADAT